MIIVRLLSPGPWLVGTTKVYSGVGADIVMESITLRTPNSIVTRRVLQNGGGAEYCLYPTDGAFPTVRKVEFKLLQISSSSRS